MTTYPVNFPAVQIAPYALAVDMGLLRTPMDGGQARQRRLYRTMPTQFAIEFVMPVSVLGEWQLWVNGNAYDFFEIDMLESMWSGLEGEIATPHSIRFVTDLAIDNFVYGWVTVKVRAELDPRTAAAGALPSYNWITGGTAPAPAFPDRVLAGTPAAPGLDNVIAGTPDLPAAPNR